MGSRAPLLILVVAVVLVAAATCHRGAAESDGEEEEEKAAGPRKVLCAPAVLREVSDTIDIRGTVAALPERDAQVSSQVAGRIARVLVREGDKVAANQTVAQIDTSPFEDEVAEARATMARARAERENAETTLKRIQRVFDRGIASRQEVDDATARTKSAAAGEAQEAAIARRAQLHIQRATVRSPFPGIVLKVMRHSGELADGTPATAIVEIADPSTLELVGDAPGQDLVRLTPDARASIAFPGLGGSTYQGKVGAVSPAVDRTTGLGVVRVTIAVAGGMAAPPIGSFGIARIASGKARTAIVVPAVALRNASGLEAEVVVCGADKQAHVTQVKTGVRLDDLIEVTAGVTAKDAVAVEPVLGIADGDKLDRAVPGRAAPATPAEKK